MKPLHIICEKDDIAKTVIISGDPLRTEYMAKHYLEDYKLVNKLRCAYIYTGYYKGKKITLATSGMGIPSMCIYAYELFKFYNVKNIIRIGTCGVLSPKVKVKDIIVASACYSISSYNYASIKENNCIAYASPKINNIILKSVKNESNIHEGFIYTSDVFDVYYDLSHVFNKIPKNIELLASEMEGFGLFTLAKELKKNAACILTCTDSKFEPNNFITPEERQKTLNEMMELALESAIKL